MTILVTGGTGFLGTALVTELMRQGEEIRLLARDEKKARERFGKAVKVIQGEITDRAKVQAAVEDATLIYHLAGIPYQSGVPAEVYQQTHVEGTRILLDACQNQKLLRFVYCSSAGVLGETGSTPVAEDAPVAPTNIYESTKLEGEVLALQAHRTRNIPVTVVRPGLVYGPGDSRLLSLFTTIKKGSFLPLVAGGKALLQPVYIDDLIRAFLLCTEPAEAIGHSYNIAGSSTVSFHEFAQCIAQSLYKSLRAGSVAPWLAELAKPTFALFPAFKGEKSPFAQSRVDFMTQSHVYSIDRARNELAYTPRIKLDEGLKLTAEWYQKHGYL